MVANVPQTLSALKIGLCGEGGSI